MKRVLIIINSFPPVNNIAARRYGFLTPYFQEHGWEPLVLTMAGDGSLPQALPEELVLRVGIHRQGGERTDLDRAERKPKGSWKVLKTIRKGLQWHFRCWDHGNVTWLPEVKRTLTSLPNDSKIDVVIGSYPGSSALWGGRYASKRFGCPWIADFRDLAALRPDGRNALNVALDRKLESYCVGTAHSFLSVSPHLCSLVEHAYQRPCHVIYNGYDPAVLTPQKTPSSVGASPDLYYAGRLYSHQYPAVNVLLTALQQLPGRSLTMRCTGPEHALRWVRAESARLKVDDRVALLPPVAPSRVAQEVGHASTCLVFEDLDIANPWSCGTLTGKLLELVGSNTPVLTIARADSDIGPILKSTGKGELVSDLDGAVGFLKKRLSELASMREGNREVIAEYSKEAQAVRLCRILDDVAGEG